MLILVSLPCIQGCLYVISSSERIKSSEVLVMTVFSFLVTAVDE